MESLARGPDEEIMMSEPLQDSATSVRLVAVGDVFLNRKDAFESFAHVGEILKAGDITFGNSEGTYAVNQTADADMMAAIIASPDNIAALARTEFDVMSVANNHINYWDARVCIQRSCACNARVSRLSASAKTSTTRSRPFTSRSLAAEWLSWQRR